MRYLPVFCVLAITFAAILVAESPKQQSLQETPQESDKSGTGNESKNEENDLPGGAKRDPRQQPNDRSSVAVIRSSSLIGSPVFSQNRTKLGDVYELALNDAGCVDFIILKEDERFVPIPWAVLSFDPNERRTTLRLDDSKFRQVPAYSQVNELSSLGFRQRVRKFYGTNPSDEATRVNRVPTDSRPRSKNTDQSPSKAGK